MIKWMGCLFFLSVVACSAESEQIPDREQPTPQVPVPVVPDERVEVPLPTEPQPDNHGQIEEPPNLQFGLQATYLLCNHFVICGLPSTVQACSDNHVKRSCTNVDVAWCLSWILDGTFARECPTSYEVPLLCQACVGEP
jgi:hypothetical protein